MIRIEIFDDFDSDALEERVNVWFSNNNDREIISVQYSDKATSCTARYLKEQDILKTIVVTHKET